MRLKFFRVPVEGGAAEADLTAFLSTHKILEVDRQFVANASSSFWAICVVHLEGSPASEAGKTKIDYRQVLAAEEFEIYSKLRSLRKTLAEQDAVPAYAIFTNEQLAAMAPADRLRGARADLADSRFPPGAVASGRRGTGLGTGPRPSPG